MKIKFGNDRNDPTFTVTARHYSVSGYADLMALRLEKPVPSHIAIPIEPTTRLPDGSTSREAIRGYLSEGPKHYRMVGWGGMLASGGPTPRYRQTAPASFDRYPDPWGHATKAYFRGHRGAGPRRGDSGSPILWVDPSTGLETVLGIAQGVSGDIGRYILTFFRRGTDDDGKPRPNIGGWIDALIGRTTSAIWDDQRGGAAIRTGDRFGSAFASADFFADRAGDDLKLPDLAVGAPGADVESVAAESGAVFLFSSVGVTSTGRPIVVSQSRLDTDESGDRFGAALTAGDFNGDGRPDLVVGAPGEDYRGSGPNGGLVFLFHGDGAGVSPAELVTQGPTGRHEVGDYFGAALAVGDFNKDGKADLVVGAPGEKLGETIREPVGAVYCFYGTDSGLDNPVLITQSGAAEPPESGDFFGASLAVGDFNGDGYDDLAVGAPGESVVLVYYGSGSGLAPPSDRHNHRFATEGVLVSDFAVVRRSDSRFGAALAVINVDNDAFDDLAVGAPGRDGESGAVFLFAGASVGLGGETSFMEAAFPTKVFSSGRTGLRGNAGDGFGSALTALDFNGDSFADLAIGAPGDYYAAAGVRTGAAYMAYGKGRKSLEDPLPFGQHPAQGDWLGDEFGATLLTLPGLVHDRLIVGAPGKDRRGLGLSGTNIADAGLFFLFR